MINNLNKILNNKWFVIGAQLFTIFNIIYLYLINNIVFSGILLIIFILNIIFRRPLQFRALSNKTIDWQHYIKGPGMIAFFTTLLNLLKTYNDIWWCLRQAAITGALVHIATITAGSAAPALLEEENNGTK